MLKFTSKISFISITVCTLISFLWSSPSYATLIGNYEVADFSNYSRAITLGSGITTDDISLTGGFNTLDLSGDNEFVKTDSGLAGFTYKQDWSWTSIVKSNQLTGYRVFMRGIAWQDKQGDFDLRIAANENEMYTWHRAPGWVNSLAENSAINDTDLVWLAGTYDFLDQKSTLYVNGVNIGEYIINPMDDRDNTNPLNINGQWANSGVGNVYGEGSFSIAQLTLSQSLYSQDDLKSAYDSKSYMVSNDDTWFDFRINSQQIPEPGSIFLLIPGLLGLMALYKNHVIIKRA